MLWLVTHFDIHWEMSEIYIIQKGLIHFNHCSPSLSNLGLGWQVLSSPGNITHKIKLKMSKSIIGLVKAIDMVKYKDVLKTIV